MWRRLEIQNFCEETSWTAATWKTKKNIKMDVKETDDEDGRELAQDHMVLNLWVLLPVNYFRLVTLDTVTSEIS
jgi:hypothetical protein